MYYFHKFAVVFLSATVIATLPCYAQLAEHLAELSSEKTSRDKEEIIKDILLANDAEQKSMNEIARYLSIPQMSSIMAAFIEHKVRYHKWLFNPFIFFAAGRNVPGAAEFYFHYFDDWSSDFEGYEDIARMIKQQAAKIISRKNIPKIIALLVNDNLRLSDRNEILNAVLQLPELREVLESEDVREKFINRIIDYNIIAGLELIFFSLQEETNNFILENRIKFFNYATKTIFNMLEQNQINFDAEAFNRVAMQIRNRAQLYGTKKAEKVSLIKLIRAFFDYITSPSHSWETRFNTFTRTFDGFQNQGLRAYLDELSEMQYISFILEHAALLKDFLNNKQADINAIANKKLSSSIIEKKLVDLLLNKDYQEKLRQNNLAWLIDLFAPTILNPYLSGVKIGMEDVYQIVDLLLPSLYKKYFPKFSLMLFSDLNLELKQNIPFTLCANEE